MYIVVGASGQVGSAVVRNLLQREVPVKGIVHDSQKAGTLEKQGAKVTVADAFDLSALTECFKDGHVLFVITPETGRNQDVLKDTQTILENYREAIKGSSVKKIIGLSSIGAQHAQGKGNLEMSYMLEHAFEGLPVHQVFIRPAYYFSNWFMSLDQIKDEGILYTFYPLDLAIPMISPQDVGQIIAEIMVHEESDSITYELEGPQAYTPVEVAQAFAGALKKDIQAVQIPRDEWGVALQKMGFSKNGIMNFVKMTDAVIDGTAVAEKQGMVSVKGATTLQQFVEQRIAELND